MTIPTSQISPFETRLAYAVNEVPRITNIGRTTIYGAIRDGKLRAVKHGRRTIILADDLHAFLAGLPVVNAAP